ncbi:hypothetical protein HPB47_007573 [Ixodes persulcatus]|uniref:Uncharacterized protein n=1 Tax=Ixodes persulcatus TaxID=34615 RepID=A0AC60P7G0_IXOPE|nr:hypothetical protein HPB47_007573 [Ixodes persulcatus]
MCLALAGTPSVLLSHLADDSSSSEDDDDGPAYEAMFRELFDASCAVPKVKECVLTVVNAYSDKEFRRNFHLARVPCYDLIDQFEGSSFFSSTSHHGGSPTKTAEEHILSFLWYVANKSSMRECALLFNMADSTVLAVIDGVLYFLCSIAPDIICFAADKGALANDFKKAKKMTSEAVRRGPARPMVSTGTQTSADDLRVPSGSPSTSGVVRQTPPPSSRKDVGVPTPKDPWPANQASGIQGSAIGDNHRRANGSKWAEVRRGQVHIGVGVFPSWHWWIHQ